MNESIRFSQFDNTNTRRVKKVKDFLHSVDLELSSDIEVFVSAKQDDEIIACGGLSGKVLKCIAVSPKKRGEGLVLSVMTELLNVAYSRGRMELFLFSTPKNKTFFEDCGFNLIEEVDSDVILMENTHNLAAYQESLSSYKKDGKIIGSIVMNANPFTLGHRYLAEQAAKACDWLHLFVVREDASVFKFADRIELVRQGLSHIKNITIHEGSDYIISKATFPTYFIKDKGCIDQFHAALDLNIFRNSLAPILGITHRFVGTEPYCVVTDNYNKNMKAILERENEKSQAIKVVEIERVKFEEKPISASRVRALLEQKDYGALSKIVPETTYKFLTKEV